MGIADLMISIAPNWSAKRERAKLVAMHYRAARLGSRSDSLRGSRDSADRAGARRDQIAAYIRDMIRNTPFATRAQMVISGHVVGDGILPKVEVRGAVTDQAKEHLREAGLVMIEDHLDTTAIDAHGLLNLYGLQKLAMNTICESGEVLIRRYRHQPAQGKIPLQIEVLEPDYIDNSRFGRVDGGGEIRDGIEYNASGQRVAYWLFTQHPGGDWLPSKAAILSERVPAEDIIHVFRVDRPGQMRGVSWFAPVAEKLMNFDDYEDAQIMRQKIAACFAAFRKLGTGDSKAEKVELGGSLQPGLIMDIGEDDEMVFANPPEVGGYEEFTRQVLRAAAVGFGITYEALTGDLTGVNFSSARIGRLEMDRNVSSWQWLMLIPMMMQPLGGWIIDAWRETEEVLWQIPETVMVRLAWVPPVRILVDPAREIGALNEAVRAGFQSRQGVVRQLGVDPERLAQEQLQDKGDADRLGLLFDSDPRADVSRQNRAREENRKEGVNE